jgi:LysM repeat protein
MRPGYAGRGSADSPTPSDRLKEQSPARPARLPPTAAAATTVIHVFRAGDSVARIAAAYGLPVEEIAAANHLTSPGTVVDGQRLVIPLRSSAARSPETADRNRGRIGVVDDSAGRGQ